MKQQQREKKDKDGVKHSAEDLKKHEQSKNAIQCNICLQGFPRTVRRQELERHLESKHEKLKKTVEDAFPTFVNVEG